MPTGSILKRLHLHLPISKANKQSSNSIRMDNGKDSFLAFCQQGIFKEAQRPKQEKKPEGFAAN